MPLKTIVKKGTLDIGMVETTPVVWQDRLFRLEWVRNTKWGSGYWANVKPYGYMRFIDMETDAATPEFARDHSFGVAHAENGVMYVYCVDGEGGGNRIDVFSSTDLEHWDSKTALEMPGSWSIYNTSVCKGPDCYMMAVEIGKPAEVAGVPFTVVFARSHDLLDWEMIPVNDCVYTRDRYSACPTIRYFDGSYYMIYLEGMPCDRYVPYIVRTADFKVFELGLKNPVMFYDDFDKVVQHPEKFTPEQLEYITGALDCNNSDLDVCEFKGKTVILYSWGNQMGKEFLAEAEYDGPLEEFLKSFF